MVVDRVCPTCKTPVIAGEPKVISGAIKVGPNPAEYWRSELKRFGFTTFVEIGENTKYFPACALLGVKLLFEVGV
jgi:hypothetical protein